jgi:NADPH-dependent 2,4-dienoyl-CoA reductase/sulfur reductase-like enzyme
MNSKLKIVVVGGNAAGAAAAAKAKRTNPEADVIIYEKSNFISTGTCEIPYVLSDEIKNVEDIIFFTPQTFLAEKGVEVFVNHEVLEIDRQKKTLTIKKLSINKILNTGYDKLILAAGSTPIEISNLSSDSANLFNLKTINDLIRLKSFIETHKTGTAAVLGAGYIGLEVADALHKIGIDVLLFEKLRNPIPSAEPEVQYLIKELLDKNGIRFFGGADSIKFFTDGDFIKQIKLNERLLEVDMVISAAGFKPNSILARSAGLAIGKSGAVKVNNKLQTSDQNIFAAGDDIEVVNAITSRPDYIPLASLAHEYGHIAGENAAGGVKFAKPVIKNISVKIFDKFFVSVGLTSHELKQMGTVFNQVSAVRPNLITVMPGSENVFGKILFRKDDKRILGASFFGGKETSGYADIISLMIRTNLKADVLSDVNYNYTPPLSPMINLLSVLGRELKVSI